MSDGPILDSAEGMTILLDFARAGHFVLDQWHKRLADKYGLDTSGVTFSGPLPIK